MQILKLAIAVLLFASCNYSSYKFETQTYAKAGLSFIYPKYWKVEEDRPVKNIPNSRFISLNDTAPFNKDAYLVITAIDSGLTLNKIIQNLLNQSKVSFGKRNIEFGLLKEPYQINIGPYKTLRVDFETKKMTTRSRGSITVFNSKGKIFSFLSHINVKDKIENSLVVDSLIKSLKD